MNELNNHTAHELGKVVCDLIVCLHRGKRLQCYTSEGPDSYIDCYYRKIHEQFHKEDEGEGEGREE